MKKNKANKKPLPIVKPVAIRPRYIYKKVVLLVLILLLFLALYIDSKTGFIASLVGDKTIEFRMRK
jgi:hypothetical protein